MKKTRLRHIFAAAVASAVALTASPIPALAADSGDFHQDLAQMLAAQDSSAYFDLMQMEIGSTTFSVDGQQQQLDVAPAVKNQRTMLPIRAVAEAAGAEIVTVAGRLLSSLALMGMKSSAQLVLLP